MESRRIWELKRVRLRGYWFNFLGISIQIFQINVYYTLHINNSNRDITLCFAYPLLLPFLRREPS